MPDNEDAPIATRRSNGPGLIIPMQPVHLSPNTLTGILSSSANARAALKPGAAIEVVVQGPGGRRSPAGRSGPDVGPALPLALSHVRNCCWNSADAGGKVFCFQSRRAHAVCTGENFHIQLPGVGDGLADRRVCSEQAYATVRPTNLMP